GFAWAQIDIPGSKDLWAVSVHLLTSTSAHSAEAAQLTQYIQQNIPAGDYLVIGGDFNSPTRTDAAVTGLSSVVLTNITPPTPPRGGENWTAGIPHASTWTSSNVSAVKIEYSADGGSTCSVVSASTTATSETFSWVVPSTATTNGNVRISDASNGSVSDTSNA